MTEHIQAAYAVDIDFRLHGFERANEVGYQVKVHEIGEGVIYQDDRVSVLEIIKKHLIFCRR